MNFLKKLAGIGVLGIVPMLIAKAMEKKTETAAPPAPKTDMFANSGFSPYTAPPMTIPKPDAYGSGIDPNQPVTQTTIPPSRFY